MPCTDGGPTYSEYDELRRNVATLTSLLCRACKLAEQGKVATDNASIHVWWERHVAQDRERVAQEQRVRARRKQQLQEEIEERQRKLEELD